MGILGDLGVKLREATPAQVRRAIEAIPDELKVPYMKGELKVDGKLIRSLDRFLYLTGCRVSEAVTKQTMKGSRVTGDKITHTPFTKLGKDPAAVWNFDTLKRKVATRRNVALPLNPEYEPWTQPLLRDWEQGNPYSVSRHLAYQANKVAFKGLGYVIEAQLVKRRSGEVIYEAEQHMKPASDHFLRHIRARELTVDYGFSDNDLMTYFGWSPVSFGKNTYMQRYQNLRWQDYFPKLLKPITSS